MKYSELVEVYEKVDSTTKRLEKTHYIAVLLKSLKGDELEMAVLLLQGRVFPAWKKEMKLGFSSKYMVKAIATVTGSSEKKIKDVWAEEGDLGSVASKLVDGKKQQTLASSDLTVSRVFDTVRKLPGIEGSGSVDRKVKAVSSLLSDAEPTEAKYIVRTVLEVLRLGIGSGTLRDAITWAYFSDEMGIEYEPGENDFDVEDREKYDSYIQMVQSAYDKLNDFADVARLASEGEKALEDVEIEVGRPLKVMLAQTVETVSEGFERVGEPAQLEYKYDGFRMQICRKGDDIQIFTRRMEDVTKQFPEVVDYVKEHVKGDEFVLDGEAVGYDPKTEKYTPFQSISQRIRRKYNIEEMSKELPVEVCVFDILYCEGESYIKKPLKERRAKIEEIVDSVDFKIRPAHILVTDSAEDAEEFYDEAKSKGMEGIMMKSLDSPYKPGSRVGYMVKLKPTMETLDLVIVAAEWGEGKRSGWLTSYKLACLDDGELKTIGKVATGMKELETADGVKFSEMTDMLKPLVVMESGRDVEIKPEIVVEVKFNEIQKSPTYSSGYALRFPRLVGVREDRGVDDASTLELVEDLYEGQ